MSTSMCSSCRMVWTVPETRYLCNKLCLIMYSKGYMHRRKIYFGVGNLFPPPPPPPPQLSKPVCPPSLLLFLSFFCLCVAFTGYNCFYGTTCQYKQTWDWGMKPGKNDSKKSRAPSQNIIFPVTYVCCEYSVNVNGEVFCIFWLFSVGS